MNVARNTAFGKEVAEMVLATLGNEWPKVCQSFYLLLHLLATEHDGQDQSFP